MPDTCPSLGLWRTVAIALMGVVVTGFSSWLLFGLNTISKADVDERIRTNAPYVHDKPFVSDKLTHLQTANALHDKAQAEFNTTQVLNVEKITQLQNEVRELKRELAALQKKMEPAEK